MNEQLSKQTEVKREPGNKPYVVSGDITILLQRWANEKGLALPSASFFAELRGEFNGYMQTIFPVYEFIPEEEIRTGIAQLVNKNPMPTITLDDVYFRPAYAGTLDITRYIKDDVEKKWLGRRSNSLSLLEQFRRLRSQDTIEARLVDDVIFEGYQTERIIRKLETVCGVRITSICAGVAIQEGIDKLSALGVTVEAVRTYDQVTDEVCERDFYPGIPFCGRTQDAGLNLGVPYILPFGKPSEWASIPEEKQEDFSQFCMKQTAKLFEAIEETSGRRISMGDIDRKFGQVRRQEQLPFTSALGQMVRNETEQLYTRPK